MDVSKLLDFVPKDLKMLALPFLVSLPMAYTGALLTIDTYLQYSIFTQIVIAMSITSTVMVVFAITTQLALQKAIIGANGTMVYFAVWLIIFAINENDNIRVNGFFNGVIISVIGIIIIGRILKIPTKKKEAPKNEGGEESI